MAGVNSTPVFDRDGQYMSFIAGEAITIGQVVRLSAANTVSVGTDNTANIGVAVGGDRFSRTQTDGEIAAGSKVTVCTRGVVRVLTGTSNIAVGSYVEGAAAGVVQLAGTGAGTGNQFDRVVGMALEANGSAAATIRVALMRF